MRNVTNKLPPDTVSARSAVGHLKRAQWCSVLLQILTYKRLTHPHLQTLDLIGVLSVTDTSNTNV